MGDRPPFRPPHRIDSFPRGKDVPDGKNFRGSASNHIAPACAPGHKTAEGKQGHTDPEELKRKKIEKQERKRIQAEREEINRRKRARELGHVLPSQPSITPSQGGGTTGSGGGSVGAEQQQAKKQKTQATESEQRKAKFRNRLNLCCKDNDFAQAMTIIKEMRQEEPPLTLTSDQYIQLLHLCSSCGEEHWKDGAQLLSEMEQFLADSAAGGAGRLEISEAMASGIIRMSACLGDVTKALDTWQLVVSKGVSRKRRMYGALFQLLAAASKDSSSSSGGASTVEEAAPAVAPVGGAPAAVDYLATGLSMLQDSMQHDCDLLQEDFVALVELCAARKAWAEMHKVLAIMQETIYALPPVSLDALTAALRLQPARTCEKVEIGESGRCPRCRHELRSIDLEKSELEAMGEQIQQLARVGDKQAAAFDVFKQWLARQPAVDAIIDGANVGYYSKRPDQGHTLSYSQVDRVIQALEKRNLRPLVIMHCRHFGAGANLSAHDLALVQRWKDKRLLYATPPKMNDDWFWLYAGVWRSSQAGGETLVMVSNDQMRDHHFQMLSTRKFLKWRERHWVNFHFDDRRDAQPEFVFPTKFSIRMQQVGDTGEGDNGASTRVCQGAWHLPSAADRTQWVCALIEP